MQWAIPIMLSMAALASNSVWAQGYSDEYKQCHVELQQAKCVLEMTMQRAYYYETKQLVYR